MAAGLGSLAVMQQTAVLPDVISYSAVIGACEKGQQWQQALGVLAMTRQVAGLRNAVSYTAAFSACEKCKQWQQALGLLAVMQRTAVLPDVISYDAALFCPLSFPTLPPSVLVRRASHGSRHWVSWRRCSRLLFCPMSFPKNAAIGARNNGQQWYHALGPWQ